MKHLSMYLSIVLVVFVISLTVAQEQSTCEQEYAGMCEIQHPLCEYYLQRCESGISYEYYSGRDFITEATESSIDENAPETGIEGCPQSRIPSNSLNQSLDFNQSHQVCVQKNLDQCLEQQPIRGLFPKAATNGTDFLVTWYHHAYAAGNYSFLGRRITACGYEADSIPIAIEEPYFSQTLSIDTDYELASNGKDYMIVKSRINYKEHYLNEVVFFIVKEDGTVLFKNDGKWLTGSVILDYYKNPQIIYANGYYYIVNNQYKPPPDNVVGLGVWKIDNEGNIIDNKFIFPYFRNVFDLAFDGENFIVFWQDSNWNSWANPNNIYALKFDENLNPIGSPTLIWTINDTSFATKATYGEGRYGIAYQHGSFLNWNIKLLLFDAATLSFECQTDEIESLTLPDLFYLDNFLLVYSRSEYPLKYNIYGIYVDQACTLSNEKRLVGTNYEEINTLSSIAYNGNKLLIPFERLIPTIRELFQQYVGVFNKALDSLYTIHESKLPYYHRYNDLIYSDGEYLAAWNDFRAGDPDIYGAKINTYGEAHGDTILLRGGKYSQVLPKLAFNGTKYAMVSYDFIGAGLQAKIIANLIEKDGTVSQNIEITEMPGMVTYSHSIAGYPGGFAIAHPTFSADWNVTVTFIDNNGNTIDSKTIELPGNQFGAVIKRNSMLNEFFIVLIHAPGADWDIYGARFDENTDIIEPFPIVTLPGIDIYGSLAISNDSYLLSWSKEREDGVLYGCILEFDGSIKDPPGLLPLCKRNSNNPFKPRLSASSFNGQNYFVVWDNWDNAGKLRGTLIDPVTYEFTFCGEELANPEWYYNVPAVASDGISFLFSYLSALDSPFTNYRTVTKAYERFIVDGVEPSAGCSGSGAPVLIKGRAFKIDIWGNEPAVFFNGTEVESTYIDCQTLSVSAPPLLAGYYNVTVVNADGESFELANAYRAVENATIDSITVQSGCETGGTLVTVNGSNFIDGVTKVFLNGIETEVSSYNPPSQLQFKTPASGAGKVCVQVANANCAPVPAPCDPDNPPDPDIVFTYIALPEISSISPRSGINTGGTNFTLSGNAFELLNQVYFIAEIDSQIITSPAFIQSYDKYTINATTNEFGNAPDYAEAVAGVCVQNSDCSPICMSDSFGFYAQGSYVLSPKIGTVSGETPVRIYGADMDEITDVYFGKVQAIKQTQEPDMLMVKTRPNYPGVYAVRLIKQPPQPPVAILSAYKYATLSYVVGSEAYAEVIDTEENTLVDFKPYEPGIQSQLALPLYARNVSFSLGKKLLPYELPGRFAFFIDSEKVLKVDTGTNQIVAQSPPVFPPRPAAGYYNDVDSLILPQGSNIIVLAANYFIADGCGLNGGILTMNSDTLQRLDYETIPELSDGSTIKVSIAGTKVFVTALTGSDGLPYQQFIIEADVDPFSGQIAITNTYFTPYWIASFDELYNIGSDMLIAECSQNQFYECLYYVAPTTNVLDPISLNPNCTCPHPNVSSSLSSPQDVTVGYIYDPVSQTYDWKAFVANTATNTWTRVKELLSEPKADEPKPTDGISPIATDIRSDYKTAYIVNTNSTGDEVDVAAIDPSLNQISGRITEISDDYHPRAIAIQTVFVPQSFVDGARTTVELLLDSDLTTPSKRQVLLNKLDAIENLLNNPSNEQAVISNTEVFIDQVDKFVVNEAAKEDLTELSTALIQSVSKE